MCFLCTVPRYVHLFFIQIRIEWHTAFRMGGVSCLELLDPLTLFSSPLHSLTLIPHRPRWLG